MNVFAIFFSSIGRKRCAACEMPLPIGLKVPLCDECLAKWEAEKNAPCDKCFSAHKHCRCHPSLLNDTVTRSYHLADYDKTQKESVCRALILRAKQKMDKPLCSFLANELASVLPRHLDERFLITYVPRRKESKSEAGYDQAKRLAKALAKQKGVRCVPLLRRADNDDRSQKEKGREMRLQSASSTYLPAKEIDMAKGKRIFLIDDVMTSGASLHACAELLNQHGAQYLFTLTVGSVAHKKQRS